MKPHEHREARSCRCSMWADEPNENCPVHGHPWPPQCAECGQFMPWEKPKCLVARRMEGMVEFDWCLIHDTMPRNCRENDEISERPEGGSITEVGPEASDTTPWGAQEGPEGRQGPTGGSKV